MSRTTSTPLAVAAPVAAVGSAGALRARMADYLELTKPRMNFLVLVTTAVGYYLAVDVVGPGAWRLVWTLIGTALTAAGASVLNQLIERDTDALMPRTNRRPLPARRATPIEAAWLGGILSAGGVMMLATLVNPLTAGLGLLTLLIYVTIYTPLKRITTLCTIVGAVPGAIPPVMGITAATGIIDTQAMILFAILFLWQMPHFLAIGILYRRDYELAGLRILPVVDRDLSVTARQIVLYTLCLIPVTLLPASLRAAGPLYLAAALVLGLVFLAAAIRCAITKTRDDARRLFVASILYLPLLLAALMLDRR